MKCHNYDMQVKIHNYALHFDKVPFLGIHINILSTIKIRQYVISAL